MDQKRLAEIKKRVMNISLAGWECYIDECPEGTTIRYGNSFVDMPAGTFYKTQNDPNTDEFVRHAPQDIMDLITHIESLN